MPSSPRPETLCARPPAGPASATTPLIPPIELSAVYRIEDLAQSEAVFSHALAGFTYARYGHPNAAQLAAKLAALEDAEAGLICASGMAAESALLLSCLEAGHHIALSDGLYGRTMTLVTKELGRYGISHSLFDPTRPETLRAALSPCTRLAFVETISNPLLRVAAIPGLAEIAREAGILLAVDNTFAPLICRPMEWGAGAVIHSLTKLIGGHSDLTLGALIGPAAMIERASDLAATIGLTGNPFESWLCLRGITTLGVRSARAVSTALILAERLEAHPAIKTVHYPGLPSHPDHERAGRILKDGFGAVVTIDVGDRADAFVRGLRHIPFAPSLGDVCTTLSHPATTSHRNLPAELLASQGITPGLIRLSIGLEDHEDLWDDIRDALSQTS